MDVSKNAPQLVIIPLIHEQPFAALFHRGIEKLNIGYVVERTEHKLVITGLCRVSIHPI